MGEGLDLMGIIGRGDFRGRRMQTLQLCGLVISAPWCLHLQLGLTITR